MVGRDVKLKQYRIYDGAKKVEVRAGSLVAAIVNSRIRNPTAADRFDLESQQWVSVAAASVDREMRRSRQM